MMNLLKIELIRAEREVKHCEEWLDDLRDLSTSDILNCRIDLVGSINSVLSKLMTETLYLKAIRLSMRLDNEG